MAATLLEHNTLNRPLSDGHVKRIAAQIIAGQWKFNGDTIKIVGDGDVIDGQHRLWAIVEAKKPVDTIIVRGIERDAFSTIDSIRKPRGGADILALNGVEKYRADAAAALGWLIRWQRGAFPNYRAQRVENSDIETAYAAHPAILDAVARVRPAVTGLCQPSVMTFIYYVVASRDAMLAERLLTTLENPAGVAVSDPFFRLRQYLADPNRARRTREPHMIIALAFKAANAAKKGERIERLKWTNHGQGAEEFPKLKV